MTLTPAEVVTLDELAALAAEVASVLTDLRREPWAVAEQPAARAPTVRLAGPGHAALDLSFGWWATGKLTIDGVFPDGITHKGFSANVSPGRGATAIARDANRRVINAGYLDELASAVARKTEQDARDAEARWQSGRMNLNLSGVPAEVALAMLKVLADAAVPAGHEHHRDGQTLRHSHPCGGISHGYFEHPEDYPPVPAGPGEYQRISDGGH